MNNFTLELSRVLYGEALFAHELATVGKLHHGEYEISRACRLFGQWAEIRIGNLEGFLKGKGVTPGVEEPIEPLSPASDASLLHDLEDLLTRAYQCHMRWTVVAQAGKSLKDASLTETLTLATKHLEREISWFTAQLKNMAPQILASDLHDL